MMDLSITLPPEWALTPSPVVRCYEPWADVWSQGKVEGRSKAGRSCCPRLSSAYRIG
jgi:hypothetical protein